jgi:hypothetical protein
MPPLPTQRERAKSNDGDILIALSEVDSGRLSMKLPLIPSNIRFPPKVTFATTPAVFPLVACMIQEVFFCLK